MKVLYVQGTPIYESDTYSEAVSEFQNTSHSRSMAANCRFTTTSAILYKTMEFTHTYISDILQNNGIHTYIITPSVEKFAMFLISLIGQINPRK